MLLRRDGATLITQPAHAWLAGRLAREWGGHDGGTGFAVPEPRDEVILATSLHDIGWLDWERRPTLNASTGLPHLFHEVAPERHVQLWAAGVDGAAAYGALPALLVSRHGDAIYEKTERSWSARAETAARVRRFLAAQARRQADLARRLAAQPGMGALVTDAHLRLVKRFVAALDELSLHLCRGSAEPATLADVPDADGAGLRATLSPVAGEAAETYTLDPWPFRARRLALAVEGRRLAAPCGTQAALDEALRRADTAAVPIVLAAPR